ncbi:CRS2-associated factor 2, mitochondrial isoform X3 [Cannabis sativa]|uniref:CRS2-associated factor 2, mitochondrial isoform X3 n=1 Tax=Cannabis sativa TaxID=3483 RepID=UPI0029CA2E11|nr:CRS2-associated factor 2, mitochondrial isoform X3 [Cannabis sativa]
MTPNPRKPRLNDLSSRIFPSISFIRIRSLIPPWNPSDSENPPNSHLSALAGLTVNGLGLLLRPGRSLTWISWRRNGVGFLETHLRRTKFPNWLNGTAITIVPGRSIWGGVTHNMLLDIHNHWKRAEAVRIKCLGVPTLDMDNVCFHLEGKSGGKIIYRHINVLLLYRGRNYDHKNRPVIPVMLWKPYAPIYPKLVKNVAEGLTFEETKELRNQGLNSHPLMILTRNGVYVNVVDRVREAFETEEVVRLDCTHVGTSDCKKIGVKLRDLVPCVPILFKDEQIILWRGKSDSNKTSEN